MERWVLNVPEWKGRIVFNYETIHICLIAALLVTGLALCFMGYKYLQLLCTVFLGICSGMILIRATETLTQNEILQMSIFITVLYVGMKLIHFLFKMLRKVLEKCRVWISLLKLQYMLAACMGAGIVSVVVYWSIYRSRVCALILAVVFAAAGTVHGRRQAEKRPAFHCYDDLCALKLSAGEESHV